MREPGYYAPTGKPELQQVQHDFDGNVHGHNCFAHEEGLHGRKTHDSQ